MTTYLLHGGNGSKACPDNDRFFAEFTQVEKNQLNILLCYWTRKENNWDKFIKRDSQKINQFNQGKNLNIQVVNTAADFKQKIKSADVFYLSGGDYNPKLQEFDQLQPLNRYLIGKTVIGSSLGAFLLCQYSINSFNWQDQKINQGFGVLPLNILCHWDIETEKDKKIRALKTKAPEYPILTLEEGKFIKLYY